MSYTFDSKGIRGTEEDRMTHTPTLTTQLHNGATVLAKMYMGAPFAVTYANRAQANKKQAELGEGWAVCQFRGRPFYVVKVKEAT